MITRARWIPGCRAQSVSVFEDVEAGDAEVSRGGDRTVVERAGRSTLINGHDACSDSPRTHVSTHVKCRGFALSSRWSGRLFICVFIPSLHEFFVSFSEFENDRTRGWENTVDKPGNRAPLPRWGPSVASFFLKNKKKNNMFHFEFVLFSKFFTLMAPAR